jgi:hypothetical protein
VRRPSSDEMPHDPMLHMPRKLRSSTAGTCGDGKEQSLCIGHPVCKEDIECQVKAGFTEVAFWDEIKDDLPAHFEVSPVAVTLQTGERGWMIFDLSFPVGRPPQKGKKRQMGEVVQPSIDEMTNKPAPTKPVHEIGQVLPRLFHFMASSTPENQEIRLSKVDLSDGFWQLCVEPSQLWNFCCVMPCPPGSWVCSFANGMGQEPSLFLRSH